MSIFRFAKGGAVPRYEPTDDDVPALLSPVLTAPRHAFEQLLDVAVNVCVCGKWPTHHVHAGVITETCSCGECQSSREGRRE